MPSSHTLYVLRGAPGSGKDTLLDAHELQGWAESYDRQRLTHNIPHDDEHSSHYVVSVTLRRVEMRMERGDAAVIIANTNSDGTAMRPFVKIARKHGYRVAAVDVQEDLTLQELLERNKHRPTEDQCPADSIIKFWNRHTQYNTGTLMSGVDHIDIPQFLQETEHLRNEGRPLMSLIAQMTENPHVRVRDVTPTVVACNFTRKAFADNIWDEQTITARGLFLDKRTSAVVARGYDKFFGLDEYNGPTLSDYLREVTYPVRISEKANGYLGIIGIIDGELRLLSKSGITDYSENGEAILRDCTTQDQRDNLRAILSRGFSLLVEVIDPDQDPHIVSYDKKGLVLLDLVRNDEMFIPMSVIPAGAALGATADGAVRYAESWIASSEAELLRAIQDAKASEASEGVVIRDSEGGMVKVKSDWYRRVKAMRRPLERYADGQQATPEVQDVLDRLADNGEELSDYVVEGMTGRLLLNIPALSKFF